MKFYNRTCEHLLRSTLALVLFLLLGAYKDDRLLLADYFGKGTLLTIVQILIVTAVCWLAFGRLRTPGKSSARQN
jgi:hypothetical protein